MNLTNYKAMVKSTLIAKHLDDKLYITQGSVEHYLKTGKVNGVLRGLIIEMMQEFEQGVRAEMKPTSKPCNCNTPLVSKCVEPVGRELLLAFMTWMADNYNFEENDIVVDSFLSQQ